MRSASCTWHAKYWPKNRGRDAARFLSAIQRALHGAKNTGGEEEWRAASVRLPSEEEATVDGVACVGTVGTEGGRAMVIIVSRREGKCLVFLDWSSMFFQNG